jgi:site-specific DNA-adenine methylase
MPFAGCYCTFFIVRDCKNNNKYNQMNTYTSAPLPFMGQKRRFLKHFKTTLKDYNATIFVDLFGGSGLLSHTAKRYRPDARVIYNDYDDYHVRLNNIERTNSMIADLRNLLADSPAEKKIDEGTRLKVVEYLRAQEKSGFVDYITLSSSLLFSMNYATSLGEMSKQTMYNCIRKSSYEATGYLDGLEIVKCDYMTLFERFKNEKDVVFFVDPPYLSTDASTYKNYWRLSDYLDVLKVLKGTSYFYFTSNKSSIIELCEWIEKNLAAENPFKDATVTEMRTNVTYSASYTDIMLHKRYVSTFS